MGSFWHSGALRVSELTADKCVIYRPPEYAAIIWGLIALGALITGLYQYYTRGRLTSSPLAIFGVVIAGSAACLYFLGNTGTVTFTRAPAVMSVQQSFCGIKVKSKTVPLDQIAAITVTGRYGWLLAVLKDGSTVELAPDTDDGGRYAAKQAIDRFLSAPYEAQPNQPQRSPTI